MIARVSACALLLLISSSALAAQSKCKGEAQLRSIDGDVSTSVKFVNRGKGTKLIYWLNYDGERVLYRKLKPNQTLNQQTYVTHPWVVTSSSGKCFGVYLPNRHKMTFTLN